MACQVPTCIFFLYFHRGKVCPERAKERQTRPVLEKRVKMKRDNKLENLSNISRTFLPNKLTHGLKFKVYKLL